MEQIIKEVIKKMVCDYAEIRIEEKQITSIIFSGKEIEKVGTDFVLGGDLTWINFIFAFISFINNRDFFQNCFFCTNLFCHFNTFRSIFF